MIAMDKAASTPVDNSEETAMTRLVNQDRQIIATWREHGIPLDHSTVEHAARMIDRLADDLDEAWRIVWQLIDGRPLTCEACASDIQPALPLDAA